MNGVFKHLVDRWIGPSRDPPSCFGLGTSLDRSSDGSNRAVLRRLGGNLLAELQRFGQRNGRQIRSRPLYGTIGKYGRSDWLSVRRFSLLLAVTTGRLRRPRGCITVNSKHTPNLKPMHWNCSGRGSSGPVSVQTADVVAGRSMRPERLPAWESTQTVRSAGRLFAAN